MFKNCSSTSSVKKSNNKLVLSLPDAITPVVWVMDLESASHFGIKIEQDGSGLYALQKISPDSKKTEDIAYYVDRKKAIKTMNLVAKKLDETKSSGLFSCLFSLLKWIALFLITLFFLYVVGSLFFKPALQTLISKTALSSEKTQKEIANELFLQQLQTPSPSSPISDDTDVFGVPMSADDFLKQRKTGGLPF